MIDPPVVGVVMGSRSDWETMERACNALDAVGVGYETRIVSAHRTPKLLVEYGETARERGVLTIIAGAGGAAHLPGMLAALTTLPVIGVPVRSRFLSGLDSLLSIVQMPAGIPVATVAVGDAGATNAGLLAAAIVAGARPAVLEALERYRREQTQAVLDAPDPRG
jgi:5-(carboxyamino)imidazole ribonucleotide mutase